MARPRSFDEQAVLSGAMGVFRRLGFSATSIRDLEQATALSSGSIYNCFGDKGGLFDAAFAHYLNEVLRQRIATHADEVYGLQGVRALFLSLLREPDGKHHGCLITNSAIEFGASDEPRQAAVHAGFEILDKALQERLRAVAEAGVLRHGIDPAATALKLVAFYQGVLVLARAGYKRAGLKRAIDLEFDLLEAA